MTAISSALDAALRQFNQKNIVEAAQSAAADAGASSSGSGGAFGNAVNVTLSASAQAALNAQASSGSETSTTKVGGHASVRVSVPATSTATDTATLIEEAMQQVIPKVGISDASEVVDSQGDIDQVKLNELIAQQNAQAANSTIPETAAFSIAA